MHCDKAREYVSAIYDGEAVPPAAAEHAARCADCRELLQEYAETGAALRSYGSLLLAEPVPERTWLTTKRNKTMRWEGLQMMRIPRIAFACLMLLLVALGSRLTLVEVRAHEDGSVLMLKLTSAQGDVLPCNISTSDAKQDHCGGLAQISKSNLFYTVRTVRKDGDRVLLSLKARVTPMEPAGFGPETESTLPETQAWFTPGQNISVPNTGDLKLTLNGEWGDHIPVAFVSDPGPHEIRLISPLLLKGKLVVGDLNKMSSGADQPGHGAGFYIPGEGRFFLSSTSINGAVPATVELNRVSFESNGQAYVIVTGAPVTRAEKIWVLHDAAYKPKSGSAQEPYIEAGPVSKLL